MLGKRILSLILLLALLPTAIGQDPEPDPEQTAGETLVEFEVIIEDSHVVDVPTPGDASIKLLIRDISADSAPPPQTGLEGTGPQPHKYTFDVRYLVEDGGWKLSPLASFNLMAGQERSVTVKFQVLPTAESPYFPIDLNITATPLYCCGSETQTIRLTGHALGLATFAVLPEGSAFKKAGPDEFVQYHAAITNKALTVRTFGFEPATNPCNLRIATQSATVGPGMTVIVPIEIETPADKLLYLSDTCSFSLNIFPVDEPSNFLRVGYGAQIEGGYINPGWIFTFLWIAIPVGLLFWFLAARKRKVEEEILGKPQKPWTIPAEQVYLEGLQAKDARAAYVVRHFLMEDEYRSSLAWYHAYKKATKGVRSREALVLKQEHALERWDGKQQRKIARPAVKADKFALRLQKKLDRKNRKIHRKEARQWRKSCKKMDKKNAKLYEKLHATWVKQSKRAEKKGREIPPEPVLDESDYKPEPMLMETELGEHKWARKAIRFEAKMQKRTAREQDSYERARARRLKKVRAKVAKIGRKLDDPDFVDRHPLLKPSGEA